MPDLNIAQWVPSTETCGDKVHTLFYGTRELARVYETGEWGIQCDVPRGTITSGKHESYHDIIDYIMGVLDPYLTYLGHIDGILEPSIPGKSTVDRRVFRVTKTFLVLARSAQTAVLIADAQVKGPKGDTTATLLNEQDSAEYPPDTELVDARGSGFRLG